MNLRAAAARFSEIAREDGPRVLWFKVWGELGYRRLALLELPLDRPPPPVEARVPLTFAREGELFVARSGGELVGRCKVARGRLWSEYLHTELPLPPGTAITYETFTAPAVRGQGVGPALRAWVIGQLRAEGVQRLLATVDPDNRSAMRLPEKLGYRRIGTVRTVGLGRRRRAVGRRTDA